MEERLPDEMVGLARLDGRRAGPFDLIFKTCGAFAAAGCMGLAAAIAFPAWTALVAATSLLAGVWAVGVVGPLPAGIARLTEKIAWDAHTRDQNSNHRHVSRNDFFLRKLLSRSWVRVRRAAQQASMPSGPSRRSVPAPIPTRSPKHLLRTDSAKKVEDLRLRRCLFRPTRRRPTNIYASRARRRSPALTSTSASASRFGRHASDPHWGQLGH